MNLLSVPQLFCRSLFAIITYLCLVPDMIYIDPIVLPDNDGLLYSAEYHIGFIPDLISPKIGNKRNLKPYMP